ncbi:MAG: hypothetical protein N2203_01960 [Bacteroidia bacterium]|nr:hypothetical protein [Bacteroidia bacterium]
MMSDSSKVYKWVEYGSLIFAFISIVLLFVSVFFSLFFAALSAVVSSVGMLIYVFNSDKLGFSKILLYSLFISSVPLMIVFFRAIK